MIKWISGHWALFLLAVLLTSGLFFFSCEEAGDNLGGCGLGTAWPRATFEDVSFLGGTLSITFSGNVFRVIRNKGDTDCTGALGSYTAVTSGTPATLTGYTFKITKIFKKSNEKDVLGRLIDIPTESQSEVQIALEDNNTKVCDTSVTALNSAIDALYTSFGGSE